MTPAVFNILLALADWEKHGIAFMQEVEIKTGCKVTMEPSTRYSSIKRMLAAGLVEESDERPDPDLADQHRRYYWLTGLPEADIIGKPADFAMPNILIRLPLDHDRMFTY